MEPFNPDTVRAAYDRVAQDYAAAFADDLKQLPVDRAVLDAGMRRVTAQGPLLDVGCGPAQVGAYLAERGVPVVGVDLTVGMLEVAQRRTAARLSLVCGDMRSLPVRSRSCAGATMFYSLQHVPRADITKVFGELRRVLVQGGIIVVATHLGEGELYISEFLGHHVDPVGGTLHTQEELEKALMGESFVLEEIRHRDPLPHEHQSERVYIIARLAAG